MKRLCSLVVEALTVKVASGLTAADVNVCTTIGAPDTLRMPSYARVSLSVGTGISLTSASPTTCEMLLASISEVNRL